VDMSQMTNGHVADDTRTCHGWHVHVSQMTHGRVTYDRHWLRCQSSATGFLHLCWSRRQMWIPKTV